VEIEGRKIGERKGNAAAEHRIQGKKERRKRTYPICSGQT